MNSHNRVVDRKYMLEYDVGLWNFGTVQVRTERQTGTEKVCKAVPKANLTNMHGEMDSNMVQRLQRLRRLGHPHICSVTEVLEDQHHIFVISDKCAGGDMAEWMVRVMEQGYWLQEATIIEYIRQVLIALAHSHSKMVYHRDLRPSSLGLTSKMPDASIKVCDLGLAVTFDPDGALQSLSPYAAPELHAGAMRAASAEADVWSLGAIAHALLVGSPPPSGVALGLSRSLLDRRLDAENWVHRSELGFHFVRQLLRPAGERPTAAVALQHPWLKSAVDIQAVPVAKGISASRDAHSKMLCYMLAVLLLPKQVQVHDFTYFRKAFAQADADNDGMISRHYAKQLLLDRGATSEAASAALNAADVRGTGVFDLCSAACANLIAAEFGCARARDLAPRMTSRFFLLYGDAKDRVANTTVLLSKLSTPTMHEVELHTGARYGDVLASFPESRSVDGALLLQALSESVGEGTPLEVDEVDVGSEGSSWRETLGIHGLGDLVQGILQVVSAKEASRQAVTTGLAKAWGGA